MYILSYVDIKVLKVFICPDLRSSLNKCSRMKYDHSKIHISMVLYVQKVFNYMGTLSLVFGCKLFYQAGLMFVLRLLTTELRLPRISWKNALYIFRTRLFSTYEMKIRNPIELKRIMIYHTQFSNQAL